MQPSEQPDPTLQPDPNVQAFLEGMGRVDGVLGQDAWPKIEGTRLGLEGKKI